MGTGHAHGFFVFHIFSIQAFALDVAVVHQSYVLLNWVFTSSSFLFQLFNQVYHYISIKGSIMLLRKSQGPILPVGHLLEFTNSFTENLLCNLSQAHLWPILPNKPKISLCINEISDSLIKFHMGQIFSKYLDIGHKGESHNSCALMSENLSQNLIQFLVIS